jgi:hypothetical protein
MNHIFFDKPVFVDDETHPLFSHLLEQAEYLRGVLLADEAYRFDEDFDASLIDPYGTGTLHFWRGVVETAASLYMRPAGNYTYPYCELKGSYPFLKKFLDFLEENLAVQGMVIQGNPRAKLDADGKLDWQIKGGFIRLRGTLARDTVALLYRGARVRREKYSSMANTMWAWESKKQ